MVAYNPESLLALPFLIRTSIKTRVKTKPQPNEQLNPKPHGSLLVRGKTVLTIKYKLKLILEESSGKTNGL